MRCASLIGVSLIAEVRLDPVPQVTRTDGITVQKPTGFAAYFMAGPLICRNTSYEAMVPGTGSWSSVG